MSTAHRHLTAALTAAARGWHVFPLRPNEKRPALHGHTRCPGTGPCADGHHGWEQRATTDPDRIRSAWSHGPFNIGIATGPSRLVVVDLDVPKHDDPPCPAAWSLPGVGDGADVFTVVCQNAAQPVPWETCIVATPSGGTHLYFAAPAGVELRNTGGERGNGLGWKVDTRAYGGYVVGPGSTVDGRAYTLTDDQVPAPLPAWLATRLHPAPPPPPPARPVPVASSRRDRYLRAAITAECAKVRDATHDRNATLYGAAVALGQLVAGGALTEDDARVALLSGAARHIGVRRFSEREALNTIASGLRAGANRPRKVAA